MPPSADEEKQGVSLAVAATRLKDAPPVPDDQPSPAEWAHKCLIDYIREFEAGLDGEHEVGMKLVSFGDNKVFHIKSIGYYEPFLICFYGEDDNRNPIQLVQHISQINVLLVELPKIDDRPRRIGFRLGSEDEGGGAPAKGG